MAKKTEGKTFQVVVDSEKCIGCGLCMKDCVSFDIEIRNQKAVPKGKGCIGCGHCEAICPQGAVRLTGFEDETESYEEQTRLDPEVLMAAIRTRRTIRSFKKKAVPREVTDQILEAGRLAPTGGNGQGTQYVVLQKKKKACEAMAVSMFGKVLKAGSKVIPFLSGMKIDEAFFFKGAPLVIVILGNDKVSASLAAENMAFMAEANGLGVLFSGFFTMCVNMNGKIRKCMGIGKKPKAVTTLVIGYPAVKYHRTVHRRKAKVIEA